MWFIRHQVTAAYGRKRILATWKSRSITARPYIPAAFQLHAWLNAAEDHFERGTQRINDEHSGGTCCVLSSVTRCHSQSTRFRRMGQNPCADTMIFLTFVQTGSQEAVTLIHHQHIRDWKRKCGSHVNILRTRSRKTHNIRKSKEFLQNQQQRKYWYAYRITLYIGL